jgi:signal transduction histidine kinase
MSDSSYLHDAPSRVDAGKATATLEEIDILSEFAARPQRVSNYRAEREALASLAREMAENSRNLLQRITELALELCSADSVGISLLDGDLLRWWALAGVLAPYRDNNMPRDASPCGVCIDRNVTQVMSLPDRCFPALRTKPRIVEALLVPVRDHEKVIGTIWVVTHGFERKFDREDERIISSLAQFASAGTQLVKSSDAAIGSSRKMDEFLAVLSHDLRNPLSSMGMIIYSLTHLPFEETTIIKSVERLDRQVKSLTRIVNDIGERSLLAHRKISIELVQIDLGMLIKEILEEWRKRLDEAKIIAHVDTSEAPILVLGDRIRLTQIFGNLLSNAIKFTDVGGTILLDLKTDEKRAIVQMRDTGRGFEAGAGGDIFEPFLRSGTTGTHKHGSPGLGLAITKQLVKLLGGEITAHSEGLGRGSTFTIVLPRS